LSYQKVVQVLSVLISHDTTTPSVNPASNSVRIKVLSTLKKPSKNCFILKRFGLFLIHLHPKNKATLGNASNFFLLQGWNMFFYSWGCYHASLHR